MNQTIYIIISLLFSLYILFELFRINILKKKNNILIVGLLSLLSIGFGLFLLVKFGLIIDYGTVKEINGYNAYFMLFLGICNIYIGLFSIGTSIVKYIIYKIKKHFNHSHV